MGESDRNGEIPGERRFNAQIRWLVMASEGPDIGEDCYDGRASDWESGLRCHVLRAAA